MALTGTVTSLTNLNHSSSVGGVDYAAKPGSTFSRTYSGSNITKVYQDTLEVTSSTTNLDLTALTDAFGSALSFSTVRHLQIVNTSATINLTIEGGGANALFAADLPLLVGQAATSGSTGSALNLTTNITVDGTHKILGLTAASGSIDIVVVIAGA